MEGKNAVNRLLINICSDQLLESKDFYMQLFNFEIDFDSDWYVLLKTKDHRLELGLIDRTSELVPKAYQNSPQGFYITLVVDNVDAVFQVATASNFEIIEVPTDTMYGQRRLLLKDPNGVLVDVSSPIANFNS